MIAISTLLEKLRRTLKDEDKNSFTDDELIDYIENGIAFLRRVIINSNPEYIAVPIASGTVDADTNEVELPGDVNYVLDVRVNGKKIKRENISSVGDTTETGEIKKYVLLNGNRMLFFPVPKKKATYSVIGIYDSPLLSVEAVTPFNSDMDNLIFEYVIIRAGMGDHFQMSQEMEVMGIILEQVTKLVNQYNQCEEGLVKGYY